MNRGYKSVAIVILGKYLQYFVNIFSNGAMQSI